MAVIRAADAPRFVLPSAPETTFIGLASPSRGAHETSVWRVSLAPGTPPHPHALDREEIVVGVGGQAVARIAGSESVVGSGDVLIIPAGERFSLENPYAQPFEAYAVLPVGGRATLEDGQWFVPPWAA